MYCLFCLTGHVDRYRAFEYVLNKINKSPNELDNKIKELFNFAFIESEVIYKTYIILR